MTREWKYPPADGFTVHHVTDTHLEDDSRNTVRAEAFRKDMANLPQSLTHNQVFIHSGDMYHNMYEASSSPEQSFADRWIADVQAHDPSPLVYAVGNHELWLHSDGDAVAQHFGLPGRNYVADHGPLRFIVYAAKNDAEDGFQDGGGPQAGDWVVPDAVLDWIEESIDSTPEGMSAVLVSHCPPKEQFGYIEGFSLEPATRIHSIMSDHPKLVAWFTGHLHRWYDDPNVFKVLNFPDHSVALIEGGCCGGTLPDSQRQDTHPVEPIRINGSVYATYFGTDDPGGHRWEIRIRDHDTQTWGTQATGYQHLFVLPLLDPGEAGELGATATSGMSLDATTTIVAAADLNGDSALHIDGQSEAFGEFNLAGDSSIRIHMPAYFTVITSYSIPVG